MATVFRLDHRGQTAGQRAVITQRGYAATRLGIEALHAPNSIAKPSPAAWAKPSKCWSSPTAPSGSGTWSKDRFPDARQRLDLFHADEHLWAVAHDLYGQGTPEARAWVTPLLQQIRDDQTPAVIADLDRTQTPSPASPTEETPDPDRILRAQRPPDEIQGNLRRQRSR